MTNHQYDEVIKHISYLLGLASRHLASGESSNRVVSFDLTNIKNYILC